MIKDGLLAEYDHEIAATRKLLQRIPCEKLTWSPHAKSRSIGGLAHHIASIPDWGRFILERTELDIAGLPPRAGEPASHADVMNRFEEAAANTRRALDKADGELMCMWSLKQDGQEVFSMPRAAAFRSFVLSHIVHHRGQLTVYLRLNDITVPSIYGPSADEG